MGAAAGGRGELLLPLAADQGPEVPGVGLGAGAGRFSGNSTTTIWLNLLTYLPTYLPTQAIEKECRQPHGFSGLDNVFSGGLQQPASGVQNSWFLAEVTSTTIQLLYVCYCCYNDNDNWY